jgi:hypothetical protein
MGSVKPGASRAPIAPVSRLCIGVTGHRSAHRGVAANLSRIDSCLEAVFNCIAAACAAADPLAGDRVASVRLHCLLADGIDQLAARLALERSWELSSPLPFGRRLNSAINAAPTTIEDVRALLNGDAPADAATSANAAVLEAYYGKGRLFELAECDDRIAALLLAQYGVSATSATTLLFAAEASKRVALAGTVMIEQSDLIIAVWDGNTTAHVGGTGHTVSTALDLGAPVLCINPTRPESWRIFHALEQLGVPAADVSRAARDAALTAVIRAALDPDDEAFGSHLAGKRGLSSLMEARWRPRSTPLAHGYRRIEALFGGDEGSSPLRSVTQAYEPADAIGNGSGAALLAEIIMLPGGDPDIAVAIERAVLRRFAWADGISARLSDAYRGGMVISFLLSTLAVAGGIVYLPFFQPRDKWPFALLELMLIGGILTITFVGTRRRWHGRWLESRRVAEYLRHSPLLILFGVSRPVGLWPRSTTGSWPEWYARQSIREIGLPHLALTAAYLRQAIGGPLTRHVTTQRDYHAAKARRLKHVHHHLDRFSLVLFQLAVVSVLTYLALTIAGRLGAFDLERLAHGSKFFTVLGVILPSFASAVAGIRYFGDFERFAAISQIAATKLDLVLGRIQLLQAQRDGVLDYAGVASVAHSTDAAVVDEIESWQSVFGGKQISIPA